ncbi:hypothetical protein NEAUS05_1987 [Nematocida ausubeli]|nr:hypothetical protein NEAUS05_1987 [Nematocida ausubeli]
MKERKNLMNGYTTRPISLAGYTENRKTILLSQMHEVSFKELEERAEGVVMYRDMHTDSSAGEGTPRDMQRLESYKLEIAEVYRGRQDVFKGVLQNTSIKYTPGDSLLMWAPNSETVVQKLMELLSIQKDRVIEFTRVRIRGRAHVFSFAGRISEYFRYFLDVTSLPSKLSLFRLSQYAEKDSDKLAYLSSKEGSADYFAMGKNWNSLLDILVQFSVKIPLESLLEVAKEIKPRAFSLINQESNECEFIAGILRNGESDCREGHFSDYIMRVAQTENTPVSSESAEASGMIYRIRHKENILFQLRSSTKNALLFGIGTGVSPFISFIRNCKKDCVFTLFYGCKTEDENILAKTGIAWEAGLESEYAGAKLFTTESPNVTVHVVYSQTNQSIRMGEFLQRNKEKIAARCREISTSGIYTCGNKQAMQSVSQYFTAEHPEISQHNDDWS